MNSAKFSWSRMWALTRRDLVENRRNLLMTLGVMFGLLLLVAILVTKMNVDSLSPSFPSAEGRGVVVWVTFFYLSMLVVQVLGSLTFSNLSLKVKRINALMLPVAQSEKFMSRILIYIVGGNIALIVSLFLADALSALLFGMAPGFTFMPITEMLFCVRNVELSLATIFVIVFVMLFIQSIYMLGSALWPRLSFLKTFMALLAIQILLPIIIPFGFVYDFANWIGKIVISWDISETTAHVLGWTFLAMCYVVTAGVYYVTWRVYKRTQVIQRFKMK